MSREGKERVVRGKEKEKREREREGCWGGYGVARWMKEDGGMRGGGRDRQIERAEDRGSARASEWEWIDGKMKD